MTTAPRVTVHACNRAVIDRWRSLVAAASAGYLSAPATAYVLDRAGPNDRAE